MKINNEPTWNNSININLIPLKLQEWLFYQGSFVDRLIQQEVAQPVITVLKHEWDSSFASEQIQLQLTAQEPTLVREVLIKSADTAWMYARTIFPATFLTGAEQVFLTLQNQSLGSILFNYPNLQRSPFEFACLEKNSAWLKKIASWVTLAESHLWARRSIFTIEKKSILLSEVFLPALHNE